MFQLIVLNNTRTIHDALEQNNKELMRVAGTCNIFFYSFMVFFTGIPSHPQE